jgi:uncharacterized membrane protein HdeD (DUF308 family)
MKKTLLNVLGVILVAIGIIGFFNNPLFGIFAVDTGHNIIHLLTGLASFYFAAQDERSMRNYGIALAIIYGLISILGLAMPNSELLGIMAIHDADNVLHILLTITYLVVAFAHDVSTAELPRAAHHR